MKDSKSSKHEIQTAILVDGGFYRKRATALFGKQSPKEAAESLYHYCMLLLNSKHEKRNLYRIFYYDCQPSDKLVYHPLERKNNNLKNSPEYSWMNAFLEELKKKRKVALRMGRLSENDLYYQIRQESFKKLLRGDIGVNDLQESDLFLNIKQKGVDMRIGVDISSLAYKRMVQQIILIAGDSDFVPASKHARREGIDFILDPMGSHINQDLMEHVDGIQSATKALQKRINEQAQQSETED